MRRLNNKPKDRRQCVCPQCSKPRMIRDLDHVVSQERQSYKTKDGTDIELFIDICDWCKHRNFTKYFEPSKADVKKVLKAMQEEATLGDNDSLEDLL